MVSGLIRSSLASKEHILVNNSIKFLVQILSALLLNVTSVNLTKQFNTH